MLTIVRSFSANRARSCAGFFHDKPLVAHGSAVARKPPRILSQGPPSAVCAVPSTTMHFWNTACFVKTIVMACMMMSCRTDVAGKHLALHTNIEKEKDHTKNKYGLGDSYEIKNQARSDRPSDFDKSAVNDLSRYRVSLLSKWYRVQIFRNFKKDNNLL